MFRSQRVVLFPVILLSASAGLLAARAEISTQATSRSAASADAPAYVAYYWRVKPGKLDDYNAYIKGTAERIDEEARKAGVFIEVTTVLPAPGPEGPAPDWTHLRIFKLKNMAAVEGLGPGLDAATLRVVPDETQRKANSAKSAEMRDFVRREVWTTLR
jgi:hypothetical protein